MDGVLVVQLYGGRRLELRDGRLTVTSLSGERLFREEIGRVSISVQNQPFGLLAFFSLAIGIGLIVAATMYYGSLDGITLGLLGGGEVVGLLLIGGFVGIGAALVGFTKMGHRIVRIRSDGAGTPILCYVPEEQMPALHRVMERLDVS